MEQLASIMMNQDSVPSIWHLSTQKFWGYLDWVLTAMVAGAAWCILVSLTHSQSGLMLQVSTALLTAVAWLIGRFTDRELGRRIIPSLRRSLARLFSPRQTA